MAGKLAAQGAGILLVTANVGSLFEDPENLQKTWLREFCQTVQAHRPLFVALHCQEVGGKNYEASMTHVDSFIKELLSSDALKDFSRARVYLDKNYQSQEQFTALGCCYFIHESLKNIQQFDFKAKKFRKVVGKEVCSDALPSAAMLEKEKFPQDYFPEVRHSVLCLAFDLVNIHLFHDASNLVAWEKSPSVYSGTRQKALGFVMDRITDQRFERLPYFIFGDFNFRLDSKQVIESLCSTASVQTVRSADTNEVDKLIFRDNETHLFNLLLLFISVSLLEFDRELSVFKERLHELDISFPPSYPYSEDSSQGKQYMNTRCPSWCDRILMSASARDLLVKPENEEKLITYDNIGPNVCMGDHKPVYLYFRLNTGAGKPHANKHKCCVVQ
uniref:inositol-polyphosphate 5-phosphatase n=1 Tax=Sinocyclocheilus grahami TaxID=75366 RepID=A0A672Q0P8_SINGR